MTLEVINAQGAQVKQLEQEVMQRNAVIQALASRLPGNTIRFKKAQLEQIGEGIVNISWQVLKDGTLVVSVKRKGQK